MIPTLFFFYLFISIGIKFLSRDTHTQTLTHRIHRLADFIMYQTYLFKQAKLKKSFFFVSTHSFHFISFSISISFIFYLIWQFCARICSCTIGWCFAITWCITFDSIESTKWYWTNKYNGQIKCANISTSSTFRWIGMFVRKPFLSDLNFFIIKRFYYKMRILLK